MKLRPPLLLVAAAALAVGHSSAAEALAAGPDLQALGSSADEG